MESVSRGEGERGFQEEAQVYQLTATDTNRNPRVFMSDRKRDMTSGLNLRRFARLSCTDRAPTLDLYLLEKPIGLKV